MNWKLALAGAAAGALVRHGVDKALEHYPQLDRVLGVPVHVLHAGAEVVEGLDVTKPDTWLRSAARVLAPVPRTLKKDDPITIPAAVASTLKAEGWIVGSVKKGEYDPWSQVWYQAWTTMHDVRGLGVYEAQRVGAKHWIILHRHRALDVGYLLEADRDPLEMAKRTGYLDVVWLCPCSREHVEGRVHLTDPTMLTRGELHELCWPVERARWRAGYTAINGEVHWNLHGEAHHDVSFIGPALVHRARWTKMRALKRPYNVMLYGPPGCGKTTLLRQWFHEESLRVLEINAGALVDAAGAIHKLFEYKADIWLIEDFDRLGEEATGKLLWLFEHSAQDVDDDPLADRPMIFATSNHPARVADAFWRPGRFDQVVEITQPEDSDAAEAGIAQMAARHGLDWRAIGGDRQDSIRRIASRHSMAHVEAYMARLAEDPETIDGPGDRTFDPPVVWSKK